MLGLKYMIGFNSKIGTKLNWMQNLAMGWPFQIK